MRMGVDVGRDCWHDMKLRRRRRRDGCESDSQYKKACRQQQAGRGQVQNRRNVVLGLFIGGVLLYLTAYTKSALYGYADLVLSLRWHDADGQPGRGALNVLDMLDTLPRSGDLTPWECSN